MTVTGPLPESPLTPWQRVILWTVLFVISSAFHAAETSITTLYPWKVPLLLLLLLPMLFKYGEVLLLYIILP